MASLEQRGGKYRALQLVLFVFLSASLCLASQLGAAEVETLYINPTTGADANSGEKDEPLRTLAAAAQLVNDSAGSPCVKTDCV